MRRTIRGEILVAAIAHLYDNGEFSVREISDGKLTEENYSRIFEMINSELRRRKSKQMSGKSKKVKDLIRINFKRFCDEKLDNLIGFNSGMDFSMAIANQEESEEGWAVRGRQDNVQTENDRRLLRTLDCNHIKHSINAVDCRSSSFEAISPAAKVESKNKIRLDLIQKRKKDEQLATP